MRKEKVKKENQVGASKPLWTIKTQWEKKDGACEESYHWHVEGKEKVHREWWVGTKK